MTQGHLKQELTKALRVVDSFKRSGMVSEVTTEPEMTARRSSPETSSSFDFFPAKDLSMSGTETLVAADQQPPAPKSPTKRAERKWFPGGGRRGRGATASTAAAGPGNGAGGRRGKGPHSGGGHQSDNNSYYHALSPKPPNRR